MKLEFINESKIKEYMHKKGIKPLVVILISAIIVLIMTSNEYSNNENETGYSIKKENKNEKININEMDTEYKYKDKLENELRKIIKRVNGVEDATVMITLKATSEEIVLKDNPYSRENTVEEESYSTDEETVMVEDKEGNVNPYVVKRINPEIEGIVVGIKTTAKVIEQEIMGIVQVLFDIPVHKIKIVNIN